MSFIKDAYKISWLSVKTNKAFSNGHSITDGYDQKTKFMLIKEGIHETPNHSNQKKTFIKEVFMLIKQGFVFIKDGSNECTIKTSYTYKWW